VCFRFWKEKLLAASLGCYTSNMSAYWVTGWLSHRLASNPFDQFKKAGPF